MRYKHVYIVAPTSYISGGPETIHQMCGVINKYYPGQASIVYVDEHNQIESHDVLEPYKKYEVNVADNIIDNSDNLLIVTETFSYFLRKFKRINKMVLFLSLAFYFPFRIRFENLLTYNKMAKLFSPVLYILYFLKNPRFIFWKRRLFPHTLRKCQISYNALLEKEFLEKHLIKSNNYLCGPISNEYFENNRNYCKEKVISYNPKKGFSFFSKVIEAFKNKYGDDYKFIPIENMSVQEVVDVLDKSVLYVDFGYFPGHERIPRQAVLRYANIIVSTNGTAKCDDIYISKKYKFASKKKNIPIIVDTMYELASNHANHIHEFDGYRELTYWQKENFEKEVLAICEGKRFDLEEEFFGRK